MTEYLDGAHEAYRRLKWAEQNRPSQQELEDNKRQGIAEEWSRKVSRFRKSIA